MLTRTLQFMITHKSISKLPDMMAEKNVAKIYSPGWGMKV